MTYWSEANSLFGLTLISFFICPFNVPLLISTPYFRIIARTPRFLPAMSRSSPWFTIHSPREGGYRLGPDEPGTRLPVHPFSMESASANPYMSRYVLFTLPYALVYTQMLLRSFMPFDRFSFDRPPREEPPPPPENVPIEIPVEEAAQPGAQGSQGNRPGMGRGISVDANRNMTILLSSRVIANHWLFLVWHIIYNLPQILAVIIVLAGHWHDKLKYYIRENPNVPWRLVTVTGKTEIKTELPMQEIS